MRIIDLAPSDGLESVERSRMVVAQAVFDRRMTTLGEQPEWVATARYSPPRTAATANSDGAEGNSRGE
ncbi:hypothetical protein [Nocardia sp. NPDC051463]|uniref:hypothetical protein n=1 Tax=Nocardia sp. NPDC051463 TaxID=3154845 RepID=UPI0034224C74